MIQLVVLVLLMGAGVVAVGAVQATPARADVQPAGGQYHPVTPARIVSAASVAGGATYTFNPLGKGGLPGTGVSAVSLNLTVVNGGTGSGVIIAYPAGTTRPPTSTTNYAASMTAANAVIVSLGPDGQVSVLNTGTSAGTVTLHIDVAGWYAAAGAVLPGSAFVPVTPARIVAAVAVTPAAPLAVAPLGQAGIPTANVSAVVAHVTVTSATPGNLTAYPDGATRPGTPQLYWPTTGPFTTQVTALLGTGGRFRAHVTQNATVTVDVVGYFRTAEADTPGTSFVGVTQARALNGVIVPATTTSTYPLAGANGIPATGVTAVAFNLTADDQGAAGAVSAWAADVPRPVARQLSYRVGVHAATLQVSKLSPDGRISIYNSGSMPVRLLLDVVGYYRPATAPAAPAGVTALPDDGGATVSWSAPGDGGAAITQYQVTASPGGATATTADTSVRVGGLTNGTAYTFTVKAVNAVGTSAASAPSAAVTPVPPAAPGPAFVTDVIPRDGGATVSWSPPPSGAGTVTAYLLKATPGTVSRQVGGDLSSAVLTGLSNGTEYRVTVTAINGAGTGQPSGPSNVFVPVAAEVPLRPPVTAVIALNQRVDLQWVAPLDGGADITGYRVTVHPGARVITVPAGTTVTSVTGLTNGTATTFAVAAVNKAGTGPAETVTATPVAARVPAAPTDLRVTVPAGGQLTAEWTPPVDTGTGPVTGYTVTAAPGGASVTVAATATSATLTGLAAATGYTLTVRATSAAGAGLTATSAAATKPAVTVRDAVVVLTAASLATLHLVRENGQLIFMQPPAQVTGLTVGAIVVVTESAAAPQGFQGRVTGLTNRSGTVTVNTVPASLTEAVTNGGFALSTRLSTADVASFTPLSPGVRLAEPTIGGKTARQGAAVADPTEPRSEVPDVTLRDGKVIVELESVPKSDERGRGGNVRVQLELDPSWDAYGHITNGEAAFRVALEADTETQVVGKVGYVRGYDKEWQLGRFKLACIRFMLGRLPVKACAELVYTAKIAVTASGGAAISVTYSRSVMAGVDVGTGGVVPVGSSTRNAGADPAPTVRPFGSAKLNVDVPAALRMFFNSLGGPAVTVTPNIEFFADTTEDPYWWELRGGVRVSVSLEHERFFGSDGELGSKDVVNLYDPLLHAPGKFSGLTIVPEDPQGAPNQPVDLDVTIVSYPADLVVRWMVVWGPGTIDSVTGVYTSPTSGAAEIKAYSLPTGTQPLLEATIGVLIGGGTPSAPRGVIAEPAPFGALVTWQPPDHLNGLFLQGYVVTTDPSTSSVYVSALQDRKATMRGLKLGVDYKIKVQAINSAGNSPPAAWPSLLRPTDASFPPLGGAPSNVATGDPLAGWVPQGVNPVLSRDGRYVFFALTPSSPLAPLEMAGQHGGQFLVRRDLITGWIDLVSREADGYTPTTVGQHISVDGSGTVVSYVATPRTQPVTVLVNNLATNTVSSVVTGSFSPVAGGGGYRLSANGQYLVLLVGNSSGLQVIYRYDLINRTNIVVSRCWIAYVCPPNTGIWDMPDISADGRYVRVVEQVPVPGSDSFRLQNILYDTQTGGVRTLYPDQQDSADTRVFISAISADTSTIGGNTRWLAGTPKGAFVKRSLTANLATSDIVYSVGQGGQMIQEFSYDGRSAIILDWAANGVTLDVSAWRGTSIGLAGRARHASLSGDGRTVVWLRHDIPGIWVQRL
ncbi:hypothetical protein Ari01nite_04810 [Paractinoplanes rishiriensis]|uniref:Fibronectin type-III domain-containing protein n=1 Tax=Paractinoplanes rishiriensis TaxID=1050105 RepID=A0A919JQ09_9ACTN|nr:hypothetical protein Ari01nite_04810 [Actinoplanes rishiriensis]